MNPLADAAGAEGVEGAFAVTGSGGGVGRGAAAFSWKTLDGDAGDTAAGSLL